MLRPLSRAHAPAADATAMTRLVLLVCCVGQFMVVLDVSIVNIALPDIFRDLRIANGSQEWVVNAYTIAVAGFLLLGGRASDLLGRRRVFLAGLSLFTAASLIGGLAPSGGILIMARALQGLGGAVVAPATLSVLNVTFTDPGRRRRAVGAWSMTAASGSPAGVLIGGILTNALGWRWVLLVNVPIGCAALLVARRCMPVDDRPASTRGLDLLGAGTITAAIGTLTYAIVGVTRHPWTSVHTVGLVILAATLLAAFVWIESSMAAHPLVPLTIFRQRRVVVANIIALIIGASMFGLYYYLSLDLQGVAHFTPFIAGLAFLPAGLATFLSAVLAPRVVPILGVRRQLALGGCLLSGGSLWLSDLHAGAPYATHVLGPLLLIGTGLGISFLPMTLAATADVAPEQAGLVAGLINTSRQLGGALGLAIAGAIVAANISPPPSDPTHGYAAAWRSIAIAVLAAVALCGRLPGRQRS